MKRREWSPAEKAERAAAFKQLRATAREWRHDPARLRQAAGVVNVDGRTLSEHNALLLLVQAHGRGIDLSTVGGFRQWHAHGRHVRKGEKGLMIYFPMTIKNGAAPLEPGADPEDVTKFRRVLVWDISQTDPGAGRPGAPETDDETADEPNAEPAPAAVAVQESSDVWTPAPASDPVASVLSGLFN